MGILLLASTPITCAAGTGLQASIAGAAIFIDGASDGQWVVDRI